MTAPRLGTAATASPLLLVLSACLPGCLPPLEAHGRLNFLGHAICDGRGGERPFLCGRDQFAMLLELLAHPQKGVRLATARSLRTNTVWSGTKYGMLGDAYIDSGRGSELLSGLFDAWAKAPMGSYERYKMAEAFVHCQCLQYIWDHPSVATAVNFEPCRGEQRGWLGTLLKRDLQRLGPKLAQGGDERSRRVWDDYQSLSRAGVWWDSG